MDFELRRAREKLEKEQKERKEKARAKLERERKANAEAKKQREAIEAAQRSRRLDAAEAQLKVSPPHLPSNLMILDPVLLFSFLFVIRWILLSILDNFFMLFA